MSDFFNVFNIHTSVCDHELSLFLKDTQEILCSLFFIKKKNVGKDRKKYSKLKQRSTKINTSLCVSLVQLSKLVTKVRVFFGYFLN